VANFRFVARSTAVLTGVLLLAGILAPSASAYPFRRVLHYGMRGDDVMALQVRVAGWYPSKGQHLFNLTGRYNSDTVAAVEQLQKFYGVAADGIAGRQTFRLLNSLEDPDGSTVHFTFNEFAQNRNSACSAVANSYAGSFAGGMVSPKRARMYVRRLMWRLEALRAKEGNHIIGINSGFRSVPYNECIGGASESQHLYGDAADNRVVNVGNHKARDIAKGTQFSGIGCYANLTHDHFDLRMHNSDLPEARFWWWPEQDKYGRDLDEQGRPCWGEVKTAQTAAVTTPPLLSRVQRAVPGAGSLVPSRQEVESFERAGEVADLGGGD
jgi:peptidoglycan hydrolase-like protein with peptidoglycan-binding domain